MPDVWYRSATLSSYSCVSWIEEATQLTKYEVLTEAPLASHVPGTYTVSEDFTNHTVVVMRQTEGLNQNIVSTIYTISSASVLQRPWAISWYEENRSTLSPMPPVLTGNMRIPEWTPGMEIKDGEYDRYPDHFTREEILAIEQRAQDAQNAKDRNLALGISFGVVGALLLALFVWRLWVVQVRKRKVARLREEGTDAQVEAGRTFWGLRRKRKDEEDERVMMKDMALPLEVN